MVNLHATLTSPVFVSYTSNLALPATLELLKNTIEIIFLNYQSPISYIILILSHYISSFYMLFGPRNMSICRFSDKYSSGLPPPLVTSQPKLLRNIP